LEARAGAATPDAEVREKPVRRRFAAGHSKRHRVDVIPLRADFSQRFRAWLATKTNVRHD
jgi:hypothetical protein